MFLHWFATAEYFYFNAHCIYVCSDSAQLPECGKLWLEDHLITPIQRIPRYILLFRELQKRTPPAHPDFNDINRVRFDCVMMTECSC